MPLVDLDDPEELRARWTALAAVAHATGFDRRWYADEDGYHHQDETGSVLRMQRLEDGRAVLFGFQTQHSQTRRADLLAGSPDWIGQPEVRRRQTAGELGFVYGAFNGTWARAAYPGDPWQPAEDGFTHIGQWITSDADAAAEMIEWVAEWADYLGGLDELQPFGVQLIQTAGSSGISLEALTAFFDHFEIDARSPVQPDLPSGVAAAEDFTRNFAVAESFADDPDTAEVSVVEDVVIGASDGPVPVDEEDEQSFIVPPGISPFTGQPIDEAPQLASYGRPVHEEPVYEEPAVYQQVAYRPEAPAEYGVTSKKQGWLRRRKHDNAPEPEVPAGFEGGGAAGGPAPGTYLPDDVSGGGLPAYGGGLPSSEPPRVGGGVHEGEDFYASLFADAPSAAYQQDAAEQDWETAEQAGWNEQEATSEYNPFADEPAAAEPEPDREWVGGAWINGQWVEDPANYHPQPAASSPDDDEAPTAEIAAVPDPEPQAAESPFNPTGERSPFAPVNPADEQSPFPADPAQAQTDGAQHEAGAARAEGDAARTQSGGAHDQADGAHDPAGVAPFVAGLARDEADVARGSADVVRGEVDSFEGDDEEELASFTGPSPFAPVVAGESEDDQTAEVPAVRVDEMDDQTAEVPAVSAELPEAKAQVEPHPQPQPWPHPQPEPWPQPEPHPAPWPQPDPQPSPTPDPFPRPEPHPEPAPSPTPDPQPHPEPDPDREPWPDPEPEPLTPEPDPTPEPQPEPDPDQEPWPAPDPNPNQWTQPHPEPQPGPGPQHDPNHWPQSQPAAQQDPNHRTQPGPRPRQDPNGWPQSEPAAQQDPDHWTESEPAAQQDPDHRTQPVPGPQQQPDHWPQSEMAAQQEPDHRPQPEPGRQQEPDHRTQPGPGPQQELDHWNQPEPASRPEREHERWAHPVGEAADYQQSEQENAPWQHPDPEDDRWGQAEPAQAQEGWAQSDGESAPHAAAPSAPRPVGPAPQAAGPHASAQQASAPQAAGPHASAQQASAPQASGPHGSAQQASAPQAAGPNAAGPDASGPYGSAADVSGADVWGGSPGGDWQEEDAGAYSVPVADADAPTGEIPVVEDEIAAGPAPIVNAHEASTASGPVDDETPTGPVPVVDADARSQEHGLPAGSVPGEAASFPTADNDDAPPGPVPGMRANGFSGADDVPTGSVPVVEANGFPGVQANGFAGPDGDGVPTGSVPVAHANGFTRVDPERRSSRGDAEDDVSAGALPVAHANDFNDDDMPTGSVPVVQGDGFPGADDVPTGAVPVVADDGFSDDETPTGVVPVVSPDGIQPESDGVGPDVGVPAGRVIERMSIPGLALAGSEGPGIELVPGSIEEALRAEVERPRPRPQESAAFEALHDWCRARTAIVPSGFTIQVQVLDPGAPSYRFDLEPPDVDDPEFAADKLSGLLGDLWVTEAESELGGWLFARIDAAGRTMRVDRWYDRVPDWWDNPVEPRLDVNGLVRRLYGRGPQWQPSYLERLYTTAR
ncbi:hypothetical protein E0H73_05940 [Kribbella pittospori]|uniref:Uncharacterized protein n=1 Tax=Kribbella pittospori TaxID=722689 RepID=A0A4R0L669_9ACTN|nr:hypothetical protein [Kribbella pittospori]TCC66418.1 hypothetical protein E0H73_05940 [Kribbella pittospori]